MATGKLNHPNIVAAHTFGDAAGVHYYAMEHCEGQSLDRYLKKGDRPIPWPVTRTVPHCSSTSIIWPARRRR